MSEQENNQNPEQQQEQPEEQRPPSPKELLRELGGPTDKEVEGWKHQYGEVMVSVFSETEVYLFRPLRRSEYRDLQLALQQGEMDQMTYEDEICRKCVLWPANFDAESRAGTASTLAEQVMQRSNFVAPQFSGEFVYKL